MLVLLALIATQAPVHSSATALMDRVVAVVNGEIITLSELEGEMTTIGDDFLREVPAGEQEGARTEIRKQVLSGMVDRLLVEQQAARRGIFVDDREVDAAVAQIMADNGLSEAELGRELARAGTTMPHYRQQLQSQILQSRLINLEIRERIVIPESRIRRYYEENYRDGGGEQGYHLLQMGFTWGGGDDQARAEARQRALAAREQVRVGGAFRELAQELSELPSATGGGDLGVFKEEEMSAEMQRHIPGLEPGGISQVIETARAYQFFKLLTANDGTRPYEEVKDEIREILYNQDLEERFEKWVAALREDAYIRIML